MGYTYTSGRITTQGLYTFGPNVRIEVRAKLPAGIGSAPGVVGLGQTGGWPQCGELALVEQHGQDKSWVYVTAYADSVARGSTGNIRYDFANPTSASTEFHVYSLDWYIDHLVFKIDGNLVVSKTFDATSPFRLIPEYLNLNVAVGGTFGGPVDPGAFPMDMTVDYVRVYQL